MTVIDFRLLITGSRTWDDADTISYWLWRFSSKYYTARLTLISGACPRGADAIAERLAPNYGFLVERHPAEWARYGTARASFGMNSW